VGCRFTSFLNVTEIVPSQGRDVYSTQGDLLSRFYEDYRKDAEEYDREFMKYDEDLNTTSIFVSFVLSLVNVC